MINRIESEKKLEEFNNKITKQNIFISGRDAFHLGFFFTFGMFFAFIIITIINFLLFAGLLKTLSSTLEERFLYNDTRAPSQTTRIPLTL